MDREFESRRVASCPVANTPLVSELLAMNTSLRIELDKNREFLGKLIHSRKVLRSLLDATAHLVFLMDYDGLILAANTSGACVLGAQPASIVGKNARFLLPWNTFKKLLLKIHDVLCTGQTTRFECNFFGYIYEIQAAIVSSESGSAYQAVLVCQDISELIKTTSELKRSEARLRTVVDNLPIIVHAHDENGNYIFWNRESESVLGYTSQEILHNPQALNKLYPTEESLNKALACWKDDHYNPCEIEVWSKAGEKKLIEWTRLSAKAPVPGWKDWEVGLDVTQRRRHEHELQRAKEDAEKANTAKSLFLASMSHEIRAPLSGIIGLSSLLLDSGMTDDQELNIRRIVMLTETLLSQLNDILDFSKIESGKYILAEAEFNVSHVLDKAKQAIAFQAQSKDLQIEIFLSPEVPVCLLGDAQCLHQVLFNLLDNAVKFTHEGAIKVNVHLLAKDQEHVQLQIDIHDTGIGIEPELQEHIFEPFHQAEQGSSRQYKGTGLGLSICKRFVELMFGNIQVSSQAGAGSTFSFTAWFRQNPEKKVSNCSPSADLESRDLHILLVEDFEINQDILYHILQKLGHRVDIEDNGHKALSALNTTYYDLILMDLQMPGMDGFEAARRIREHTDSIVAQTPIIALSAHSLDHAQNSLSGAGINSYLMKPVQPLELKTAIEKAVKNS